MALADEYRRQFAWRSWPRILEALPLVAGETVLDLGCGVGDLSAELSARGAKVIGFDLSDELLAAARSRRLPKAEFRSGDLRALPELGAPVDGVWCSFGGAYFVDLATVLAGWAKLLRPGGWIALTEIDDLFCHQPLNARTKELLDGYALDALAAGRYDMHMGRKLRGHLERAGFSVVTELTVPDLEFSFEGPARPDVLEGWRSRFDRMSLLKSLCGAEFEAVRDDFLAALARPDHRSRSTVRACIGVR